MARRQARVLYWPVDPLAGVGDALLRKVPTVARPALQFELFPAPPAPNPHSFDHLVVRLTAVLIRVTRLGELLTPMQVWSLWGVVSLGESLLPEIESRCALEQERAQQEYHIRIA